MSQLKKDKRNVENLYLPLKTISDKYDFNFKKNRATSIFSLNNLKKN